MYATCVNHAQEPGWNLDERIFDLIFPDGDGDEGDEGEEGEEGEEGDEDGKNEVTTRTRTPLAPRTDARFMLIPDYTYRAHTGPLPLIGPPMDLLWTPNGRPTLASR
jgi:hypothetical protein